MDVSYVITIATIVFASTGFWSFITEFYRTHGKAKTVLQKAVLALLHDKLYCLCDKQINVYGNITADELENLTYLFEPYKEMGGNSTCEQLYNECKALPKVKAR